MEEINIEDFAKLDIRICTIVAAIKLPESDKLLKLTLDTGTEKDRQVLAGIAQSYPDPTVLIGRQIPVLLNLKPRKMRGEISNGMILAAGDENDQAVLLQPIVPISAGSKIR